MANPYDQVPLGQQTNQLGAPDNYIQQSDMTRFQMISQYQSQNYISDFPRSSHNYTMQLSNPRFNYGTNGIDTRFYQRQNQMQSNTLGASLATATNVWAPMAPMAAPGLGLAAGIGMGVGLAIPAYFVQKGIDRTIQRQRAMQQMSSDVEQYREQLGMPGMSMSQASSIGSNLTRSMFSPGQFFNPQKQQEILRYGLTNDMLSSKGRGMVTGDAKTFEKNFQELMETVTKVSKTMKVTAEGAMSVIKEMQMGGFGTMGQIRGSVTSAHAYGSMTGLGASNMLQIGAAGAQAVQGTPYSASAGAQMYMGGAAMAGHLAKGNDPRSAKSVEMVGGVAQAGGIIGQTMMNIMQSGMGARVLASVMTKDGKLDVSALSNLNKGTQSGHDIITRASQRAHGWGSGGNVMFARNRSEVADQIAQDPILAAQLASANFNAWRSNRRGTREQQAQAYAQTFVAGGQREQNLFADWMLSSKGLSDMNSEQFVSKNLANQVGPGPSGWKRFGKAVLGDANIPLEQLGESLTYGWQGMTDKNLKTPTLLGSIGGGLKNFAMNTIEGMVPTDYGIFKRGSGNIGSMSSGYKNLLGLTPTNLTTGDLEQYRTLSSSQRNSAGIINKVKGKSGFNAETGGLLLTSTERERELFYQTSNTVLGNSTAGAAMLTPATLAALQIKKGSDVYNELMKASPVQQSQIIYNRARQQSDYDTSRKQALAKNINATSVLRDSLSGKDLTNFGSVIDDIGSKTQSSLRDYIISKSGNKSSMEYRAAVALKSERDAIRAVDSKVETYVPGSVSAFGAVQAENNAKTLHMLGLKPGGNQTLGMRLLGGTVAVAGTAASIAAGVIATGATFGLGTGAGIAIGAAGTAASIAAGGMIAQSGKRQLTGLGRLAGVNASDFARDPSYGMAKIAEKVMSGGLDMYVESDYTKEEQATIKSERKQLKKAFGLKGDNWESWSKDFRQRFGNASKMSAEQMAASKFAQGVVGKNESFYKFLGVNGIQGQQLSDVKSYLDPLSSTGFFSKGGGTMSNSVANAIATGGLLGATTSAEVQKMAKSGELFERMYTGSKDVGKVSQIATIQKEIDRILTLKDGEKTVVSEDVGGKGKRKVEKYQALEMAVERRKLVSEAMATSDTSEGPKGRGLTASVTPPILNYWNSKWSM
jgi:hypothetical protein